MILVFDLDDTLYEELTFVKSGFYEVAKFIASNTNFNKEFLYTRLIEELNKGRGQIFDIVLKECRAYTKTAVRQCIHVYRSHKPRIHLFADVKPCFERFKKFPRYIVTDGNKIVQANKIKALHLDNMVKHCFITRRYGIKYEKPSPYCFQKICEIENVPLAEVIYIGDNPNKDFVGIKPLGYRTIRILRGNYKNTRLKPAYEAELEIASLDELTLDFFSKNGLTK